MSQEEQEQQQKFLDSKFFQTQFFLCPNFFGPKCYFRPKFFSDPKFFFTKNFFGPEIFFDPKFFLDPTFFQVQNFFWATTFFLTKIFFWHKMIFGLIFLRPKTIFRGRKQSFWSLNFLNWQRAKVLLKPEFDTEDQVLSIHNFQSFFYSSNCAILVNF